MLVYQRVCSPTQPPLCRKCLFLPKLIEELNFLHISIHSLRSEGGNEKNNPGVLRFQKGNILNCYNGLPEGSWWFQMFQAIPLKETQIRKPLKNSSIYEEILGYTDILWIIFESRTLPLFCHLSPAWPEPAKTWKNLFNLCQHTIHRLLSQVANFSQNFWTSSCASANARGLKKVHGAPCKKFMVCDGLLGGAPNHYLGWVAKKSRPRPSKIHGS